MTRDEILNMAREACGADQDPFVSGWVTMDYAELGRFTALVEAHVAAAEREACAKLCEQSDRYRGDHFAYLIRARSKT